MSKKTLFFTMLALGLLAACSKPAPQPAAVADDEEDAAPSAAAVEAPVRQETPEERAKQAEGLMVLLKDSPNCQSFRDEMQAAGKSGTVPINDMVHIIGRASQAGCATNPKKK